MFGKLKTIWFSILLPFHFRTAELSSARSHTVPSQVFSSPNSIILLRYILICTFAYNICGCPLQPEVAGSKYTCKRLRVYEATIMCEQHSLSQEVIFECWNTLKEGLKENKQFKEWRLIYHPKKIDWTWTVSMFRNVDHNFEAHTRTQPCLEKIFSDT